MRDCFEGARRLSRPLELGNPLKNLYEISVQKAYLDDCPRNASVRTLSRENGTEIGPCIFGRRSAGETLREKRMCVYIGCTRSEGKCSTSGLRVGQIQ